MKVYTGVGDKGETSLFDGTTLSKSNSRICAYGEVDELNAHLTVLIEEVPASSHIAILKEIQILLFHVGSELATPAAKHNALGISLIEAKEAAKLEAYIDSVSEGLEPLKAFVLPGGSRSNALAHVCRTVCRRAERSIVQMSQVDPVRNELLVFINRLSDFFFVISRDFVREAGAKEVLWREQR